MTFVDEVTENMKKMYVSDIFAFYAGAPAVDVGSHDPDEDQSAIKGRNGCGEGRKTRHRGATEHQSRRQECI